MKLYLRYLLWQLTLPTLLAMLAFSAAVWLSQSLRFVDLIVNKGLPLSTFLYLTLFLFPSLLMVILPFALVGAVLFVYHRLTVESELMVLRAAGLSNLQLAAPCLLLAAVVTLIGYAISLYLMPLAYRSFSDLQDEVRRDFSHVLLQPGVFNEPIEGVTVYVRERLADGALAGIVVHDERRADAPITMMAEHGMLIRGAGGPLFLLERGNRQELNAQDGAPGDLSILHFDRYGLDLTAATGPVEVRARKPKELYLHELLSPSDKDLSEAQRRRLIAEGHKRLTWPLNALAFALLALAALLGPRFDRQGPGRTILLALIGIVALQLLVIAAGNFAARSLALVPLLYAATLLPALGCAALILRPPLARLPAAVPDPA
jgi:lipopolysaccharide export system permease protein